MKDGLTQVKELKDKIHEQYIEIQELNKRVEDLKTINEEHQILNGMLRKENDRLNNIINELENFCEEQVRIYTYEKSIPNIRTGYSVVLNELRKLKGNNKK